MNDLEAVVIDNGSQHLKFGLAGNEEPYVFKSIVGHQKHQDVEATSEYELGADAQSYREILSLKNPVHSGTIVNWDDMEKVWSHVLKNELNISVEERSILMSEAPYVPVAQRERMTQVMFENFNVYGFFVYASPILAMYASGTTTGLMVESGEGVTSVMPIYNGVTIPGATIRDGMSGQDVTDYFTETLNKRGCSCNSSSDRCRVQEIKESCGYILKNADSLDASDNTISAREFVLPDSTVIQMDKERFQCPEILFRPYVWGRCCPGIQDMVHTAIARCDVDVRRAMWENVVLAGGNTMFQGYRDRLRTELSTLAPSAVKVFVVAAPERKHMVWIGGSILASLTNYRGMYMTKSEYDEYGPGLVMTKCSVTY